MLCFMHSFQLTTKNFMFHYKSTLPSNLSMKNLLALKELRNSKGIPTANNKRREFFLVCEKELTKDEQETLFLAPAAQNNQITL